MSVTIVWYKDGQPLDASENLVFYDDGRLVILNVADSDAGRYHCEIQSSEGDATGFPLNVSIAGLVVIHCLNLHCADPDYIVCRIPYYHFWTRISV